MNTFIVQSLGIAIALFQSDDIAFMLGTDLGVHKNSAFCACNGVKWGL